MSRLLRPILGGCFWIEFFLDLVIYRVLDRCHSERQS